MNDAASSNMSPAVQTGRTGSTARPGCVSALVILLGMRAIGTINIDLYSIASALMPHSPRARSSVTHLTSDLAIMFAFDVILAVLWLICLWGLWRMKNWARVLLITIQAVTIAGYLVLLTVAATNHSVTVVLVESLILALVVGGVICWWFIPRRKLFA